MKQTLEEAKREYIEKYVSRNEYASFGAAFEAGAEWHKKQSPWVSVKERLPEENTGVFLLYNGKILIKATLLDCIMEMGNENPIIGYSYLIHLWGV